MVKDFLNSKRLKKISRGLVIFTPSMTLLYMIFRSFNISILDLNLPLGFLIKANRFLLVVTLCSFLLFIPALINSGIKSLLAYLTFILMIPFFCVFTIGYFYSKSIDEEISFDNKMFYFVVQGSFGDPWANYYLFICNSNGFNCREEASFTSNQTIPAEFQISDQWDQLHIFLDSEIEYIFTESLITLNTLDFYYSSDYWIALKSDANDHNIFLSRCSNPRIGENCSLWLLEFSNDDFDLGSGEFSYSDIILNEFHFFIGDELIFSVADEPMCHIEGCSFIEQ